MAEFEKYIPKRINKDMSPEAIARDGDRLFFPGDLIDALNCRYHGRGKNILASIRGNVRKMYDLPEGTNKVVGWALFEKEFTIIYCVYNSNGFHQIIEFDPVTEAFVLLIEGYGLAFSEDRYLRMVVIDSLAMINDGINRTRMFDIIKARDGFYDSGDTLNLATRPPLGPPTCALATASSLSLNYISGDTWQFAYRYVYKDHRESTFSPLSKLVFVRSKPDPGDTANNAIDVTIAIPSELVELLRSVEVVYRTGNSGNYYIFNIIENPTLTTYTVRFTNNGKSIPVSDFDQNRIYEDQSPNPDSIESIDNRIFLVNNRTGFDIDTSSFNLAVALGNETPVDGKRYFKGEGKYGIGIIFQDIYGRTSFVKSDKYFTVPVNNHPTWSYGAPSGIVRYFLNWELTGSPPPGMAKYQIVLSHNSYHLTYAQMRAYPHLYMREIQENETDNSQDSTSYLWRSKKFLKLSEDSNTYQYVYLQIPLNLPFIPDASCFVRFLYPDDVPTPIVPIIDVIGDFIVIDKVYTEEPHPYDIRLGAGELYEWPNGVLIEVFKPLNVNDETFFEIGEAYDIVDDQFSVTSGKIYGDTYRIKVDHYYTPLVIDSTVGPTQTGIIIESPSGVFSNVLVNLTTPIYVNRRGVAVPQGTNTSNKNVFTADYARAASDFGRIHTIFAEERKEDSFTTVSFSEKYIQESKVNGLSVFPAANKYSIPIDRGPIRCLKRAGDVLLAIHDRQTSTMYIGEGILRQGSEFMTAKVDSVVGDDRQLEANYGTINPESVIAIDSQVYFWDAYHGAVVRYTKAGLFPISNFGMRQYFRDKGRQLMPYRDRAKVVCAFDEYNNEFIISFHNVTDEYGNILINGETWAFNIREEVWTTRYSFVPESYAYTSSDLFSFKNGEIWKHEANPIFNNFYDTQYVRSWRFVCNPYPGKDKRFLNVHIAGAIGDGTEDFVPVRAYTKEGQETFIPAYEFFLDQGKWCAPILRDINTPNVPTDQLALRSGDDMVSNYLEVEVINNRTDESPCGQVNVVYKNEAFSV